MTNILAGIDFTEADEKVLARAKELAQAFQVELHLLHIYPIEPVAVGYSVYVYPGEDERKQELQEEKARLSALVESLREEGISARAFMKEAATADGLLEFAAKHDDGLLVLGTHSRNFVERALLGSTVNHVIKESKIPVLVVPTI